ncbi:YALI0B17072p [Yarrowia lipolytica CLIB122]|uniref:Ubiquitin carboxyl-terminal hydrolase n=2 Tax=Yarrowia lipolytica TaxID=4952 RepID=Q6CEB0_YARLI|nr:YALI0B17072p [Yarrowia lipolytica CLIB122]AOW01823.1 hypothetical protein YALI1_B22276g [Yarrowia lipolytica]KAB8285059.1 hypothetical protein BKA91DRAFT_134260 [Yarrowia lipolytica]KAE8175017.1 hypothetical protein BKA90DRAFT_132759 [Yarrowia lipolytica]KAJ8052615.1 hypothetical protein LXG23DRAFT_52097 [Yarrowia lipolytica]RMJ01356.1 hypothetical protein BD777DRAFT_122212 [Yarrowia lipolytica]|eukprot:XP_501002.1 YALI0B17072p [Yarrowia lipolytica CLIB122]
MDPYTEAAINLQPPNGRPVHKDDCAYSFDTPDLQGGLDVCLSCFQASSAHANQDYTKLHFDNTGHSYFATVHKKRKAKARSDENAPKRLAIEAHKEEDDWDTQWGVKLVTAVGSEKLDETREPFPELLAAVENAESFAARSEVAAWENEIVSCEHTRNLNQSAAPDLNFSAPHCAQCDLKENLWLCLDCGAIGCGRAQFGGVAGNTHALAHSETTGHGVAVKLGSITAHSADVYCYICNDERQDPELRKHLSHFGIQIDDLQKTEKSMTELQIEQNYTWQFSMENESGEIKPVFGPGLTGMNNLGNSCYLNSAMQVIFSLPAFQKQFNVPQQFIADPINSHVTQFRKLADGLLSGRYAVPDVYDDSEVSYQRGIRPFALKTLLGKGHPEFSTNRQQDAFEFWAHVTDIIDNKIEGGRALTDIFRFQTEKRLQCLSCNKVRYTKEAQENLSVPVPIREKGEQDGKTVYEDVELSECLIKYTGAQTTDYSCKCGGKEASVSNKFASLPDVLVLNSTRFQIKNWVPMKVDVNLNVDENLNLDDYISPGKQDNEEELPEDEAGEGNSSGWTANETAVEILSAMGFPTVRCEKALYHTGNSDPDAAMNWLFSHMEDADIDEPLVIDSSVPSSGSTDNSAAIAQVAEMGFTPNQARKALRECSGNVEMAVAWLFENPADEGEEESAAVATEVASSGPVGYTEKPHNYELTGIICHKGTSVHAGHYVAYVKKDGKWILFNDEKVVSSSVEDMKKLAYVYVFQRVSA